MQSSESSQDSNPNDVRPRQFIARAQFLEAALLGFGLVDTKLDKRLNTSGDNYR
jgi:hypothetical protein